MTKYNYVSPLEQGYKQFKLTRKQHNKLFKRRKKKWYDKYEYYYDEYAVMLHKFRNLQGIIFQTIIFPVYLLLYGLFHFKEIIREYKGLYNQKKYGSFSSDYAYKGSNTYREVMKIINQKEKNKSNE